MKRKNEINMIEGNLFYKLIIMSIPLILSGILQLFYNAADLIVCGMFGSEHAVASISSTNALVNLIINLFLGLSTGANVLMARCFGQNNKEKGQKVVYTSMIFSLVFGVFVGLFGFFMSKTFLIMMGTPEEIIDLSGIYLKIYFLGLPFSMIYNFGASLLRATGDTKRPFYFLAIAGLVNVLLNLLFVIVFKMDVAGVALATISAQAISAILIAICLCKNDGFFRFNFKQVKFYAKEALEIVKIGLPAGIQGAIFSLSNVLIQSSVNSFGTAVMDGNGAASSLEGFVYTAMNSVAHSCVAFVSANYGAKKKENIKKVVLYAVFLVILMDLLLGGLIFLFKNQLLDLYVNGEEAILAGINRLSIIILTYFICGIMDVLAYSLRGIGHSLLPTVVSLIGACAFRIVWIFTIFKIYNDYSNLIISYPISWILTSLTHFVFFVIMYKKLNFGKKEIII